MPTGFIDVVSNSAMLVIDDVRLTEEAASDPALFYRRMSLYVINALPLMSRPPELMQYLEDGITYPIYADDTWTSTEESTSGETTVQTGLTGYDLFSCVIQEQNADGTITNIPYTDATYDSETGNVTFPQQESVGIVYDMNFYTDGSFANDLTPTQMRLLGLGIACVWDERFTRNWLNIQMKIHDDSFNTVNESTYMRESTERLVKNRRLLNDELIKYEQDCNYAQAVSSAYKTRVLL